MTPDVLRCLQQLELPPSASWDEVQNAYRDLIKVWHPDRFGSDERLRQRAEMKAKELNEAIRYLRRHYRKTMLIRRETIQSAGAASGVFQASAQSRPGAYRSVNPNGAETESRSDFSNSSSPRFRDPRKRRQPKGVFAHALVSNMTAFTCICICIAALSSIGMPDFRFASATSGTTAISGKHLSAANAVKQERALNDYRLINPQPELDSSIDQTIDERFNRRTNPISRPAIVQSAVQCDLVQLRRLISADSAGIDATDENGDTALAWAARLNCLSGAKLLLNSGANPQTIARNGFTPLAWAKWAKNSQVVDIIERHQNLQQRDSASLAARKDPTKRQRDEIVARPAAH